MKIINKALYAIHNMNNFEMTSAVVGSAGTATVNLTPKIQIVAAITTASAKMATTTIETAFAFKVIGVKAIKTSSNVGSTGTAVIVKNNTDAITDTIVPGTGVGGVDRETTINPSYDEFAIDENDLVITISGSSAGSYLVVIDIMLV